MGRNQLLQYVENVYKVELQRYGISKAIQKIDSRINEVNNQIKVLQNWEYQKIEKLYKKERYLDFFKLYFSIFGILFTYFGGVIGFIAECLKGGIIEVLGGIIFGIPLSFVWPVFGPIMWGRNWFSSQNFQFATYGIIIGTITAIIIGIIKSSTENIDKAKKNRTLQEKNKQIILKNKTLKAKNESEIKRLELYLSKVLYPEKKKLIALLKNTDKLLQEYYGKNIIGKKYRSLLPVSFFYEYLNYEICDSLTGPDGAYNIFEQYILLHNIHLKLDSIIEQLEDIKDNQREILIGLKTMEQKNDKLMCGLKNQLNNISANQRECCEAIEYHSSCIEEQQRWESFLLTWHMINKY